MNMDHRFLAMSSLIRLNLRRTLTLLAGLGSLTLITLLILDHHYPPDLHRARDLSAVVVDHQDRLLRAFTTADDTWRLPVTTEAVAPRYFTMLQAYEDHRFSYHPGVDPLAMTRALGQWLFHGEVVSGASTLTMQTARLLEPRPRTLGSKLIEILRALQLEWRFSKKEILDLYLTLAPYGGNLEGIRAASLAYFGKEPAHLTDAEAALLVVLPQSPSRLRPDRFAQRARQARDKVLGRVLARGLLESKAHREALEESIPQHRSPLPFLAPHLARRLTLEHPQAIHRTLIDVHLQAPLEAVAHRAQERLDHRASLAILVAENRTRAVRAYVASADFFASQRAGQVDMIQAIRSPGSTLKPVIYGLGFEDMIIHPETLVADVPTRFGDYAPGNFRDTYSGEVTIREALQRSLNIPAVRILEQVGPSRVTAALGQVGVQLQWSTRRSQPGLPLVLGGVGMSLADLVTLYTGIAQGGLITPLRYRQDDPPGEARPLFGQVAAWYLADILREAPPPVAELSSAFTRDPRRIAYKTGTSYGFRDAWAVGFDDDHTVGVWVGRPDGAPSPGHYGRNTAAPLLFQVFDLLPPPRATPTAPPAGVLNVANAQLPPPLQRLDTPGPRRHEPSLTITFPVDGSRVELSRLSDGLEPLPLLAEGGRRPLRWMVNGEPVATTSSRRRQAFWQPDGEGFARITVIDGHGRSASARVRLVEAAL